MSTSASRSARERQRLIARNDNELILNRWSHSANGYNLVELRVQVTETRSHNSSLADWLISARTVEDVNERRLVIERLWLRSQR